MTRDTANPDLSPEPTQYTMTNWTLLNLVVLGMYLAFFYLCLAIEWPWSMWVGLAIALGISILCIRLRRLFLNRYEFTFYLAIPLDVGIESLIPHHAGYGFYWCAVSFWSVFVFYRIYVRMFAIDLEPAAGLPRDA